MNTKENKWSILAIYSKVSLKDQEYDESRKSHMLEDLLPSKAIQ
jgi:hypothetical protein